LTNKRNISMLKRVGVACNGENKNSQTTVSFALYSSKRSKVQNVRVTLDASQSSESSQDLHIGEILAGNETLLQAHDETHHDAQDEDTDP
jgi:hypothetical protein